MKICPYYSEVPCLFNSDKNPRYYRNAFASCYILTVVKTRNLQNYIFF